MKLKYKWKEGNNDTQHYYDVKLGKTYLLVFANKWKPNLYMGMISENGFNRMIHDKTRNDRVRKKWGLKKGCSLHLLQTTYLLCNKDPKYMMKKVEYCFAHSKEEVSA